VLAGPTCHFARPAAKRELDRAAASPPPAPALASRGRARYSGAMMANRPRGARWRVTRWRSSGGTPDGGADAPALDTPRPATGASLPAGIPPSLLDRLLAARRPRGTRGWPWRLPETVTIDLRAVLLPLLLIPALAGLGASWLAARDTATSATLAQRAAPLIAEARRADAARPRAAALLREPTVSEIVERLARALPADARLHALAREPDGALVAEIDVIDPDALRPALSADALLATLDEVAQQSVADRGIRVTLRAGRP